MISLPSVKRTSLDAIAARIERLPLGRFHRRFITLVSLGNFFDLYDIFVVAYIGAALQQSHFLTLQQFTAFIASGFFGMFVGTIAFGMGSDRFGRRIVFMTLLLLYSVFTLACAFAPSATWLIVLRFFAGAGIGAEIIVIDAYVSEIVPSRARGRYVAITQVVGFCAVPVAALLARVLVPTHFLDGWMALGRSDRQRWRAAHLVVSPSSSRIAALARQSWPHRRSRIHPRRSRIRILRQSRRKTSRAIARVPQQNRQHWPWRRRRCGRSRTTHLCATQSCRGKNLLRRTLPLSLPRPHSNDDCVPGAPNRRLLRLRQLGADISSQARILPAPFARIHHADRGRLADRSAARRRHFRSHGAQMDDRRALRSSSPHLVWDSAAPARRLRSSRSARCSRSPTIGSPPRSTRIRRNFFPRAFALPPSASPTAGAASAPHFLLC